MRSHSKQVTIYLEPQLHQALKAKSIATQRTMSDLVNEMIRRQLAEDTEDLETFEQRANETFISLEVLRQTLFFDSSLAEKSE